MAKTAVPWAPLDVESSGLWRPISLAASHSHPISPPTIETVAPSANYTLTGSEADVTGWTKTIQVPRDNARVRVDVQAVLDCTDTPGTVEVFLNVDGTSRTPRLVQRLVLAGETEDMTFHVTGFWWENSLLAGPHTLKMRAKANGATPGNGLINATHSLMSIMIW